jgi:hypothetical protein
LICTVPAKKKTLYINHSADMYGASRGLLKIVESESDRGLKPITALSHPGPRSERLESAGFTVYFISPLPAARRARGLR